jgi:hypothetical protein
MQNRPQSPSKSSKDYSINFVPLQYSCISIAASGDFVANSA